MTISLGENLKHFRTSVDLTQEQLAEKLGVSPQAVSRWETAVSYPDIAMLPVIAAFFNISVDTLLGVDPTDRKKQIEEILNEKRRLSRLGKMAEISDYLQKKLKEYPDSGEIMTELAGALYLTDAEKHSDEIIALCQKAYKLTDDMDYKFLCMQTEALTLADIGKHDKALEIAKKFPNAYVCRGKMIELVSPKDEANKQKQQNIVDFADLISLSLYMMSYCTGTPEQNIEMLEKAVQIITIIMGEDAKFYNDRVFRRYLRMSELYCELKDSENTFKSLELAIKYADMYETRPEGGKFDVYWLNLIEDNSREATSKSTELNAYEEILEDMEKSEFDFIRNDRRFDEITLRLKEMNRLLNENTST